MVDLEGYDGFKIKSRKMLDVLELLSDLAKQGYPMIMFGPSGAGKEFLARYYFAQYHKASKCSGNFISLNCAQLLKGTAPSILFGHVKGAFTDAYKDQTGQFEQADKGVLFLDEIGDLDREIQVVVNRAIDENTQEANRLGSEETYSTKDVLVIAATERPKTSIIPPLLFRLGVQVQVPGLDDRDEDVEEAIKHFCRNALKKRLDYKFLLSSLLHCSKDEIKDNSIHDPQIESLIQNISTHLSPIVRARDWPGNFRALRTAVDSGVIRAKKLNSHDEFVDNVKEYFLHHLGDYSISSEDNLLHVPDESDPILHAAVGKWLSILNDRVPDLDNQEKTRLGKFLSEYSTITFKRKDFEQYMMLNTRSAQLRISLLIDNDILEKAEGKRYKYSVNKRLPLLEYSSYSPPQFMKLPEHAEKDFMPEKVREALGIIENSRGIFISDNDSKERVKFLSSLGTRLSEDYDVIYYSFHKKDLNDFMACCIKYLTKLDIKGWFRNNDYRNLDIKEQLIGLSGYFTRSLSRQRNTIIILEGIDAFSTGESQALIENMIYYWYPVQFILSSKKQFFHQQFSSSIDFMELKIS